MLAQELEHHMNKGIPAGIVVQSFVTLVGFWMAGLPLFMIVMVLYRLVTMPLPNAYSHPALRKREAD